MVKIFITNNEYIDFLTSLSIEDGEVFCTIFLPSSFFPKHSIETFFKHKDRLPDYKKAVSRLWEYGKYVYRAIAKGSATLCVEINSLHAFCESGLVHNAVPNFEVGFPVRVNVLKRL